MKQQKACASGQGRLEEKLAFLDDPQQRKGVTAERILAPLALDGTGGAVLDLGAGSGYLTIPIAQQVRGPVYALDSDPRMLRIIGEKAQDLGLEQVRLLEADMDKIPLEDGAVEIVLASLVLHEAPCLEKTLEQVGRVLKRGGRLLCVEYERGGDQSSGPAARLRISRADLEQALLQAGLVPVKTEALQEKVYLVLAEKAGG